MSADVAQIVVSGAVGGSFALAGVMLTDRRARRRERQAYRGEVALSLADVGLLLREPDRARFRAALSRYEISLQLCHVAPGMILMHSVLVQECWKWRRLRRSEPSAPLPQAPQAVRDALNAAHSAITAELAGSADALALSGVALDLAEELSLFNETKRIPRLRSQWTCTVSAPEIVTVSLPGKTHPTSYRVVALRVGPADPSQSEDG